MTKPPPSPVLCEQATLSQNITATAASAADPLRLRTSIPIFEHSNPFDTIAAGVNSAVTTFVVGQEHTRMRRTTVGFIALIIIARDDINSHPMRRRKRNQSKTSSENLFGPYDKRLDRQLDPFTFKFSDTPEPNRLEVGVRYL